MKRKTLTTPLPKRLTSHAPHHSLITRLATATNGGASRQRSMASAKGVPRQRSMAAQAGLISVVSDDQWG